MKRYKPNQETSDSSNEKIFTLTYDHVLDIYNTPKYNKLCKMILSYVKNYLLIMIVCYMIK